MCLLNICRCAGRPRMAYSTARRLLASDLKGFSQGAGYKTTETPPTVKSRPAPPRDRKGQMTGPRQGATRHERPLVTITHLVHGKIMLGTNGTSFQTLSRMNEFSNNQ